MYVNSNSMKSKTILFFSFFLISSTSTFAYFTAIPTFKSCGLYIPYDSEVECRIFFKKQTESEWKNTYPPIYDQQSKEFRVSIVKLSENTFYDIKIEMLIAHVIDTVFTGSFKTWKSEVSIQKTIDIEQFKENSYYFINNVVGTEDGWIKIKSNSEINLENTSNVYAIGFSNCKYVILEGIKLSGGYKHGILIPESNSEIRIINCDISRWGRIPIIQNECGEYLDVKGERINNDAGIRIENSGNIVVERCYIHDPRGNANPWSGVVEMGPFAGSIYEYVHPGGPNAIYVKQSTGGIVIKNNDLIGAQLNRYNDVIETAKNGAEEGGFNKDSDIYGNMLAFCQDDAVELDGGQCNVRFFNNRMEQAYDGISTAPNMKGPSYIFNNIIFNLGSSNGVESTGVKNGGGIENTKGRQFLFHNTFVTTKNTVNGVGFGSGEKREMYMMTTRNNIFVSQSKISTSSKKGSGMSISDMHKSEHNDFDYDMIGNTTSNNGVGAIFAKAGSESHGVFSLPSFTNKENAVFTLLSNDAGIDKGIQLPNFYNSNNFSAPDMGAFEYNTASSLIPIRPLNIVSDKYFVKLKIGVPVTINLTIGELEQNTEIQICKSLDMDWLSVVPDKYTISSNSNIKLTLTATRSKEYRQLGILLVRISNGLSVPISLSAN